MLSIASQCIHVTIPLPLDLFHPVTLFSSERRPAALVLSILKGAPGFCAYGSLWGPSSALDSLVNRSQRPYCAFPHACVLFRSQWERHRDRG